MSGSALLQLQSPKVCRDIKKDDNLHHPLCVIITVPAYDQSGLSVKGPYSFPDLGRLFLATKQNESGMFKC